MKMRLPSIVALWAGALLAAASLSAVPKGALLHLPLESRTIVAPIGFQLQPVELRPEVEVVVLFYSASWCAPCKQAAQALRAAYPEIAAAEPRLQLLTYSLDRSADARADYLRTTKFPWPAIAPELVGRGSWPDAIAVGTPSFQAFAVSAQHWRAITAPGEASDVFQQATFQLNQNQSE